MGWGQAWVFCPTIIVMFLEGFLSFTIASWGLKKKMIFSFIDSLGSDKENSVEMLLQRATSNQKSHSEVFFRSGSFLPERKKNWGSRKSCYACSDRIQWISRIHVMLRTPEQDGGWTDLPILSEKEDQYHDCHHVYAYALQTIAFSQLHTHCPSHRPAVQMIEQSAFTFVAMFKHLQQMTWQQLCIMQS